MLLNDLKMNSLNAMRRHLNDIVVTKNRPFSYLDFLDFELDSIRYKLSHGTIRNYLSILAKSGEIVLAYNSGIAFYTIPGKQFTNNMTHSPTGGGFTLIVGSCN